MPLKEPGDLYHVEMAAPKGTAFEIPPWGYLYEVSVRPRQGFVSNMEARYPMFLMAELRAGGVLIPIDVYAICRSVKE